MTRKEFLQLSDLERNVFIAKLINAINQNDKAFDHADYVVVMSEKSGNYNVKFGSEVYQQETTTS